VRQRALLATAAAFLVIGAGGAEAQDVQGIDLISLAGTMRDQSYVSQTKPLAPPFADLDYDAYREIRPLVAKGEMLPHGDSFAVDLLPPGLFFTETSEIDRVIDAGVQEIAFSYDLFDFEPRYFDRIPSENSDGDFSGLRLRYLLNAHKGFGLNQTARSSASLKDTEAVYHDRPSAWIAPQEDWGPGAVMLVEQLIADDFMGNIVAFWRPETALEAGGEYRRYAYRLTWTRDMPDLGGLASFVQGRGVLEHKLPGLRRFVVDVAAAVRDPAPDMSPSDGAELLGASAFVLPDQDASRMTFLLARGDLDLAELRLSSRVLEDTPVRPVWLPSWTCARDGGV